MQAVLFSQPWLLGLPIPERPTEYRDKQVIGLRLRHYPTNRKVFSVVYRKAGERKLLRKTIGKVGVVSLSEARQQAREIIARAGRGETTENKQEQPAGSTFRELVNEWLDRHAKANKRSWKSDEQRLAEPLDRWGDRLASEITRRDVIALLDAIVDRGAPIQANRTLAVLRTIFRWAIGRDLLNASPCYLVKAPSVERPRDRVLSNTEIRALWEAAGKLPTPSMRGLWKMRLVTAQRGQECRLMRWDDLDLEKRLWTIPAASSKNKQIHLVPLSGLAIEIIEAAKADRDRYRPPARRHPKSPYVFPGRSPQDKPAGPLTYLASTAEKLQKATKSKWTGHDLRRTAATAMGELGVDRFIVSKVLNHTDRTVTGVYDRFAYVKEKRDALDRWATRLAEILKEKDPASKGERKPGKNQRSPAIAAESR